MAWLSAWSEIVFNIAVFVLKKDVKLQPTSLESGANDLHGPADATATLSSLANSKNPEWFNRSSASLPRLSWQRGHHTGACLSVCQLQTCM